MKSVDKVTFYPVPGSWHEEITVVNGGGFQQGKLRIKSATILWSWPRWLRYMERLYHWWKQEWQVSTEFEVLP